MARWTLTDLVAELETALHAVARAPRVFVRWFRPGPSAAPLEGRLAPFGEHEKVEESKFLPPVPPHALKQEDDDPPAASGRTRLVMLVIDPYRVHTYWDVTADDLARTEKMIRLHADSVRPVLRFHDAAVAGAAEANRGWFDVEVDLQPRNWYVQLWSADKTYTADLGLRGDDGRFVSLARSNVIRTPRAWPAVGVEEHFMRIERAPERAESVPPPVYVKPRRARPAASSAAAPAAGEPARDSAATVLEKLTEFRASRLRAEPIGVGARPIAATPPASFAEQGADLTEMAEQTFVPGLSSAMAPGTRAED